MTRSSHSPGNPAPHSREVVRAVIEAVSQETRVSVDEILGHGHHHEVVRARHLAFTLARELSRHSYPELAEDFGRPSHSTIISGVARLRARIKRGDTEAADLLAQCRAGAITRTEAPCSSSPARPTKPSSSPSPGSAPRSRSS